MVTLAIALPFILQIWPALSQILTWLYHDGEHGLYIFHLSWQILWRLHIRGRESEYCGRIHSSNQIPSWNSNLFLNECTPSEPFRLFLFNPHGYADSSARKSQALYFRIPKSCEKGRQLFSGNLKVFSWICMMPRRRILITVVLTRLLTQWQGGRTVEGHSWRGWLAGCLEGECAVGKSWSTARTTTAVRRRSLRDFFWIAILPFPRLRPRETFRKDRRRG